MENNIEKIKVSVIIPIYKVERFIDECLKSVVAQTHSNLEIILVDDGSPDNCPKICDDWKKQDDRIQVIHKENGGLSSARNAGLNIATGDYIIYVDSDDWISKDMIETMLEYCVSKQVDMAMCGITRVYENGDMQVDEYEEFTVAREELLKNFLYHRKNLCSSVWNKIYKRDIVKELRFPDGLNSEDYCYNSVAYSETNALYVNTKPLYFYRIREDSICTAPVNEHSFDKIKVAQIVGDYLEKRGYENKIAIEHFKMQAHHDVLYSMYFKHANKELKLKYKKELRKYILHVLKDGENSITTKIKFLVFSIFPALYFKISWR